MILYQLTTNPTFVGFLVCGMMVRFISDEIPDKVKHCESQTIANCENEVV